jgi:hypothetical protein
VSSLQYTPEAPIQAASVPTVASVTAIDQRREEPTRLATIMGGFGNPLKTLDTAKPVKDEVADAFTRGLRLRGLQTADAQGRFQLVLTIRKFDADMIVGRTARIDMTMTVKDSAGHAIYEDQAVDSESDTKFFETGILADIKDLQTMCEKVLSRSVDRLLDSPNFRLAIRDAALNAGSL